MCRTQAPLCPDVGQAAPLGPSPESRRHGKKQNLLSRQNQTIRLGKDFVFRGPCPPFSFGDTDACGAWPASLRDLGECFRPSTAPTLQRPLQPWWACLAALAAPLGAGSSSPGPGAGWAPSGLSEAHRQAQCDDAARATGPRFWVTFVVMETARRGLWASLNFTVLPFFLSTVQTHARTQCSPLLASRPTSRPGRPSCLPSALPP